MAKVVRFHQLGGPEVLRFEEQPSHEPGPGEVRLRVQAVGLNRAEALYMRGASTLKSRSCHLGWATRPPAWLTPWARM